MEMTFEVHIMVELKTLIGNYVNWRWRTLLFVLIKINKAENSQFSFSCHIIPKFVSLEAKY